MARSIQRERVTRGRLARTLAVAMLGSSLLAFSAAGAAFVGLFSDNDQAVHGSDPGAASTKIALSQDRVKGTRQVKVLENVSLPMTAAQYRRFTQITSGDIDERDLELFLLKLLPASLAEKVHFAIVTGLDMLPDAVEENIVIALDKLPPPNQDDAASDEGSEPAVEESEEPKTDEPTPQPSPTPGDEETPGSEETPEDQNGIPLLDDDGEG